MAKRGLALLALAATVILAVACEDVQAQQKSPGGKKLTLERLYTYPRLEGTPPIRAKWSDDGRKLAFLWNDQGMRFRDLWLYHLESKKLTRLTDLDQPRDRWTKTEAHKDPKLKKYLPPESGLSSFEWAPDSKKLAFDFRGELYLIDLSADPAPLRLTKTKRGEDNPHFTPDSNSLVYTSEHELWALDLTTAQRTQLTSGGSDDVLNGVSPWGGSGWRTFEVSPDGRWLVFIQIDRTGERTQLVPNYSGREVKAAKQRRGFAKDQTAKLRLGLIPAGGGEVIWLTAAERQYYNEWRWSPDSTQIVLNRAEENWKQRHLDMVDVARALKEAKSEEETEEAEETGKKEKDKDKEKAEFPWVRTIYSESDDKWICTNCDSLAWSPDGKWILFTSERDAWNHLYRLRADTKSADDAKPRQLTRGGWEVETRESPLDQRPRFSRDGRRVYFTSNAGDLSVRHLYWVGVEGGEPYRLTDRPGYNAAVVSPDDRHIALLHSSFAEPWDLYLRMNAQGEAWSRLTTSPLPEFSEYQWPQPKIVEFPARDGKTVRALLFPPTELAADFTKVMRVPGGPSPKAPAKREREKVQRVPVINFVHGAGYAQAVLNRWGGYQTERFHLNQFLSQHGYAVIDVDYRGSSGYGRDWRTDVYLHLGGKDLDDELAAMDFLKTQSYIDTDRAGIWGVSYGGFMTLVALFLSPDTFQAGSAWAAVTDWENYHRHYTQQRLRSPEDEPEAYQRSSPIHHVEGLSKPLLLVHGIVDDNVHFQDAAQLVDALVAAGKDFDLLAYPQSRHGWARPEVWLHSTRAMFDFFEKHLKKN